MTKQIELTQGKYALVDDSLYDELNQYKWHVTKGRYTYYARRNIIGNDKTTTISMHRHILGLFFNDGNICDHINRDGLDNRCSNLRTVNHLENGRNHNLYATSTSGFSGVTWRKDINKWRAIIWRNGKQIALGCYNTLLDATLARKQGELKYWKEIIIDDPDHPVTRSTSIPSGT